MKKVNILVFVIFFLLNSLHAQKIKINDPIKSVYKLFEEMQFPAKDSLVIYALNFEVSIAKKNGKTIVKISRRMTASFHHFT